MGQNNVQEKILFIESGMFFILRIILFIVFIIILFKSTETIWVFGLTTGALVILVMFKRLDFFEIMKVVKAGINYNLEDKTSSEKSSTPEELTENLKKLGSEKIIKSEFPEQKI